MCFRIDSLHERVGVVTFSKLESGSCDALYVMLDTLLGDLEAGDARIVGLRAGERVPNFSGRKGLFLDSGDIPNTSGSEGRGVDSSLSTGSNEDDPSLTSSTSGSIKVSRLETVFILDKFFEGDDESPRLSHDGMMGRLKDGDAVVDVGDSFGVINMLGRCRPSSFSSAVVRSSSSTGESVSRKPAFQSEGIGGRGFCTEGFPNRILAGSSEEKRTDTREARR